MAYLCRTCGQPVKENHTTNTAYCANCKKELAPKETIASWTFDARVEQLKAMHTLMSNANDERIYCAWIVTGMPDGATKEDYEYIACDDELYTECFNLFARLIQYEGNRW